MTLKDNEIERLESILSGKRPNEMGELHRSLEILLNDYLDVNELKLKIAGEEDSTVMLIKVSGKTKRNLSLNGYKLS